MVRIKNKGKISRKQLLKESDELLTFFQKATILVKKHAKKIIVAAAVVVVAGGVVGGIQAYLSAHNLEASQALGAVFEQYQAAQSSPANAELMAKAQASLKQVSQTYSATPAGLQAKFYLGNLFLRQKNFTEAEKLLRDLSEEPSLTVNLKPLVLASLGQCLEGQAKYGDADRSYAAAQEIAGPILKLSLSLDRARVMEAEGNTAGAESVYRDILSTQQDQSLLMVARSRLVAMGLEPDIG